MIVLALVAVVAAVVWMNLWWFNRLTLEASQCP